MSMSEPTTEDRILECLQELLDEASTTNDYLLEIRDQLKSLQGFVGVSTKATP